MKFKVDENTIWEDTGKIVVFNYPPDRNTFSWVARIYKQYTKDSLGYKEVEGSPIFMEQLDNSLKTLVKIIGEAQQTLQCQLPREEYLTQIKD